jgi:hypothetical protein
MIINTLTIGDMRDELSKARAKLSLVEGAIVEGLFEINDKAADGAGFVLIEIDNELGKIDEKLGELKEYFEVIEHQNPAKVSQALKESDKDE